jgi:hypothetical protein
MRCIERCVFTYLAVRHIIHSPDTIGDACTRHVAAATAVDTRAFVTRMLYRDAEAQPTIRVEDLVFSPQPNEYITRNNSGET